MKKSNMLRAAFFLVTTMAVSIGVSAADSPSGKAIYDSTCVGCHGTGAAGAPKLGDAAAWAPRIKMGASALVASAIKGKGIMPARGGNPKLSDAEVKSAVNYILGQSGGSDKAAAPVAAKPAVPAAPVATQPVAAKPAVVAAAPVAPVAPAPAAAVVAPEPQVAQSAGAAAPAANVNTFNRLMRPAAQRNLPPPTDGIHDPANDGTHSLQPPLTAFTPLPKSNDGNRIDWVKSLNDKLIAPRFDRNDPAVQPMVMDLNIVREVKGSMPDVVYPHKQHTEWLDCSNCHPAIFIPQKGANQISMAAILLGQKCGVCHGKVAFPISDCRRCHSKSKPVAVSAKP